VDRKKMIVFLFYSKCKLLLYPSKMPRTAGKEIEKEIEPWR
jgi:hypothetical protein